MNRTRKGSLALLLASLLLIAAAAALSVAVAQYGLHGALIAFASLIVVGSVGIVGVRNGEQVRGRVTPVLAGIEDQFAAILVCAWMVTITFNGIQVVSGVSLGDVPLLGAAVLALLGTLRRRGLRRSAHFPGWLGLATYLLVVSGVAGPLLVGGSVSQNLVPVIRFAVTLCGVPAVLTLVGWSPRRRRLFVHLWLISVGINCIVAISDRFGTSIGLRLTGFNYSNTGREAGLTQHPTHLGLVCAMALPVVLTLGLDRTSRLPKRLASLALLSLIAWTIVLTGSRTALVAAAISALAVPIFVEHTRIGLGAVLGTAVALAIMAALVSPGSLSSISPLPSRTGNDIALSNLGHISDVQTAQTLFLNNPLVGNGFSNARSAQDIYLQLLEAGGIVALVAFVAFVGGVLRAGLALVRQLAPGDGERALAGALTVATVSWLAEGVVQPPIYDRYLYLPAGLIVAMTISRLGGWSPARELPREGEVEVPKRSAVAAGRDRVAPASAQPAIHVLHVTADLVSRSGGPPRFVVEACASIATHGVKTTIVTTDLSAPSNRTVQVRATRSDLIDGAESLDVRMYRSAWTRAAFAPRILGGLRDLIKSADLVHIHSLYLYPEWAAYRAATELDTPYIVSPHGALDPYIRRRHRLVKHAIDGSWQRGMLEGAAALHFTSDDEAKLAEDVARRVPRFVIPAGLSTASFTRLPPRGAFRSRWTPGHHGPLILNIGRISFKKGLDILIRAAARLVRDGQDVRVVLVGPDDEGLTPRLREVAREVGISDRVIFTGLLEGQHKLEALADATVWALPSHSENFGIAVAEALAAGVPVVVSDKVNIARAIRAARAGFVCPQTVDAFARDIARALQAGEDVRQNVANGRDLASSYDWEVVGSKLACAYRDILAGSRAPSEERRPGVLHDPAVAHR